MQPSRKLIWLKCVKLKLSNLVLLGGGAIFLYGLFLLDNPKRDLNLIGPMRYTQIHLITLI